jgi:hypothetical protein
MVAVGVDTKPAEAKQTRTITSHLSPGLRRIRQYDEALVY